VPPGETGTDCLAGPPRRQAPGSHRPTIVGSIAWRSTPCRQVPCSAGTPLVFLSFGAHTRAAKRYISSEILLVFAPKTY